MLTSMSWSSEKQLLFYWCEEDLSRKICKMISFRTYLVFFNFQTLNQQHSPHVYLVQNGHARSGSRRTLAIVTRGSLSQSPLSRLGQQVVQRKLYIKAVGIYIQRSFEIVYGKTL